MGTATTVGSRPSRARQQGEAPRARSPHTLHLALDRAELSQQRREIARRQLGMTELTVLGTMQEASDLHVRRPTGQQVVELVRIRMIFRMLAWRARDAQGVPLLEQCVLDALFCGWPVQAGHVIPSRGDRRGVPAPLR